MHKIAKRELQVTCSGKKWTLAIGSHHNLLIFYSRYPLEGALDIGDISKNDFEKLALFFSNHEADTVFKFGHNKWTLILDESYRLNVLFMQYPFNGSLNLGEISKEHCQLLSDMFIKASKL